MHKNAVDIYIHTESDNGFMNENKLGFSLWGFKYKMLIPGEKREGFLIRIYKPHRIFKHIPKVIKGVVKSTADRRSYVIVRSHRAKSAFWKIANIVILEDQAVNGLGSWSLNKKCICTYSVEKLLNQSIPFICFLVQITIIVVGNQAYFIFEFKIFCNSVDEVNRKSFVSFIAF